jgi:stage V sporulation protein AF
VNINYLKDRFGVGKSFDVIFREYKTGKRRAASFSINGLTNDLLLTNVFEDMITYDQEELTIDTFQKIFYSRITHSQVTLVDNMNDAMISMLSGEMIILVDKADQIIVVDARSYPVRYPEESSIEKVTRGSRDAFVETLPFNTSLIRRRLRDPNLRFEVVKVGERSQCDVAVAYIKDIANPGLVDRIKESLNDICIDGIPMAAKALEEYIVPGNRWNPLPLVRYSERPDVVAVHLLEGHVCLVVDTTPETMILPTTLWHHIQHAEEYLQNPLVGSYLRLVRLGGIILSMLLPPLWLALILNHHFLPEALGFLGPRDPGTIPLGFQFILAEIGLELVRMATIHVPTPQSTALGFIGAIMLGQFATKVGFFGNEVIFYMSIAAVGAFATPSVELSMAVRMFRIGLLVCVMFLKLPGFILGMGLLLVLFATTKSFGIPYLWPLIPLDFSALKAVFFRLPVPDKLLRPAFLKPRDKVRGDNDD